MASEAEHTEALRKAVSLTSPCVPVPPPGSEAQVLTSEQREAVARAEAPIGAHDRIGGRVEELWLSEPQGDRSSLLCVRVTCQGKPPPGSVWGTFHVELPPLADVAELRRNLGTGLPPQAQVLALKPLEGLVQLHLLDPVPDKVTITEFTQAVTPGMIIRRNQALEVQDLMKSILLKESVQAKIAECRRAANDDDKMHGVLILQMLTDHVFPTMAEHLGVSGCPFSRIFMQAMNAHGEDNLPQTEKFFELEELMGNPSRIAMARQALDKIRYEHWMRSQGEGC